ncbi:DsbA family protein [Congregibacter brevis]|uniref:DsbA family protein n=1 Tax=Congregibacter brevis TaxID=3081201 RepID=A0ABZ0I9Y7_9GAMM|nr:DsbA family protein [Congregibacter sp. IMCC45268]
MAEQFTDQGGVASIDPSPLRRWLTSKLMTRMFAAERMDKRRASVEKERLKEGAPHRVEYFHQVDDGYSHLAAQVLQPLVERYDIELECHLVEGPSGKNAPETDLLLQLSRYDSFHVAPEYGLEFPKNPAAPDPALVQLASSIVAAQGSDAFTACAAEVGKALWTSDEAKLQLLAATYGQASAGQCFARIVAGTQRRTQLKHYSGAMFYYGGEWYWGVDRLYHLEKRLSALGADRQAGQPMIVPRPDVAFDGAIDNGTLTLEVFPSLRSPYTSIVFDRAKKLARESGVKLSVRPVLPMVMRGVPATREKGLYIFMDAAREAREAGVPYGNFSDPIGEPARRCYSLYPWAVDQGRGVELLSSFLRNTFACGIKTNNDRGLRKVVEDAGLDWSEAQVHLGQPGWEDLLEQNRLVMYDAGLWGVPSFRLLDERGEQLLALWGQDRLWVFAREIQRQLKVR